jgi:hypothetical protein
MYSGRERSRAAIIANMLIFCLVEVEHGEGLNPLDILWNSKLEISPVEMGLVQVRAMFVIGKNRTNQKRNL